MERMVIAPANSTKVENTTRTVLLWTAKARALFNLNNRFEALQTAEILSRNAVIPGKRSAIVVVEPVSCSELESIRGVKGTATFSFKFQIDSFDSNQHLA
jgi:hypothetical protein